MTSAYRLLLGPILPVPHLEASHLPDGWLTPRDAVRKIQGLLGRTVLPGVGPWPRVVVDAFQEWHPQPDLIDRQELIVDSFCTCSVTLRHQTLIRDSRDSPPEVTWCSFGFGHIGLRRSMIIRFSVAAYGQLENRWFFFPINERTGCSHRPHEHYSGLFNPDWVTSVYGEIVSFISEFTIETQRGSFATAGDVRTYLDAKWRRVCSEFMAMYGIGHLSEAEARSSSLAHAVRHLELGNRNFNLYAL